jgi:hypothetical protein
VAPKKKKATEEYSSLAIKVDDFDARIDASINYEARDPRSQHDDVRVYSFESSLEISGVCTYPEDRAGMEFFITVYGRQRDAHELDARLSNYHVRDEHGIPKYRKSRGKEIAVYNLPKGMGLLQTVRGEPNWSGWLWVSEETVSQMLTLLTGRSPLYLAIHERKVDRTRWINGLCLQTTDPAEE